MRLVTPFRKNRIAFVGIMAIALLTGLGSLYISEWFAIPFLLIIVFAHRVTNRITCPSCGTPIAHIGKGAFGVHQPWIALYSKKCEKCGADLDKSS